MYDRKAFHRLAPVIIGLGMAAGLPVAALAQDTGGAGSATLERPIHIHEGTCAELTPAPAFPLASLAAPDGAASGADQATAVESSVSTVDVGLDALLSGDYAINAHLSADEISTYIACGEIGGARLAGDAVAIGLREQDGSGFAGIAYLAPNASNPLQTDVSVFLAEDLLSGEGGANS